MCLEVAGCEMWVGAASCELQVASCELRVASFEAENLSAEKNVVYTYINWLFIYYNKIWSHKQVTGRLRNLCLRPKSNWNGNKIYSRKVRCSTFIFCWSAAYINVNIKIKYNCNNNNLTRAKTQRALQICNVSQNPAFS